MKTAVFIDGNCRFCRFCAKILAGMCGEKIQIDFQGSPHFLDSIEKHPHANWVVDSIKVLWNDQVFIKSRAIEILVHLAPWYYQGLRIFFFLPYAFLDRAYDFVAKNRLIWGSSVDACEL
ncbi:thiol-disulfide oxidoreductase DCC family protein [Aquirufa rosea]|uniref:DUF393 domain-containing protein n=1 Tax=Aquirufa rosea TaxID=2509241 RepID=A0A4Q1BXQ4_9BACT|nr:DCC1-like thiol-disulfide oxidoreductase family protein [Aquirufa rosea]RXK47127.1 DUF393 domain-containing protein [Aquirufa rosea]